MHKTSFKFSRLLLIIPIGVFVFILLPELTKKYNDFKKQETELKESAIQLVELQQIEKLTTSEFHKLKTLEIGLPIRQLSFERQKFLYYKTGGMFIVLLFMGIGMLLTSFLTQRKKNSPNNRTVDFQFNDPDLDTIGKQISWEAKENSGSNFASETLKKTAFGYKITSSSFVKVFAWSFFLVGLNYVVLSFIEFYSISQKQMTIMQAGKLFFSTGGIFLLIGLFLLFSFGAKVHINKQQRKIIIDGQILSFKDLHALQILEKFTQGKSSGGYFCYEVNLITKDGKRYNLLNHGDKVILFSDMMKIHQLFKTQVWCRVQL
jgi:hypothetical protein